MENRVGKKKVIIISFVTPIFALLLAFLILCLVGLSMYSPAFMGRVLTHWDSSVTDFQIFPERVIRKGEKSAPYERATDTSLADRVFEISGKKKSLREFVDSTDTTSFLIAKGDKLVYEQYGKGYDEASVQTSFSMAKSVVSLLIGKAIENGDIQSEKDPIDRYIEEFKGQPIGEITIEELLLMRSDIAYDESGFLWFGDDSLTYWYDDLRQLALTHTELIDGRGKFHYNNYHPLLLGIILERSTGVSVSAFFEREIWQKLGAQYDASWSLDGESSGFEKMESGINFRSVDFLKIGSMVLHGGMWNGERIIGSGWLNRSCLSKFPIDPQEYEGTFLAEKNIGYQYMWYSTPSSNGGLDIIAWGKSDQILYISPSNDCVVLRTGTTDGGIENWVETIRQIISKI